jgi:hypothetical protein
MQVGRRASASAQGRPQFSRPASSSLHERRRLSHAGLLLLATALAIVACGCAGVTTRDSPTSASTAASTQGDRLGLPPEIASALVESGAANGGAITGVSGVWQGISTSDCIGEPSDPGRCRAMQRITLTMFQQGTEVTGFYKCAFGNQMCRNLNESGVIHNGTLKRTRLMMRVMHDDGSMCFFTGRPAGDRLEGGYECLQGGGIIEQGTFQTRRTY